MHAIFEVLCLIEEAASCLQIHKLLKVKLLQIELFNVVDFIIFPLQELNLFEEEVNLFPVPVLEAVNLHDLVYLLLMHHLLPFISRIEPFLRRFRVIPH